MGTKTKKFWMQGTIICKALTEDTELSKRTIEDYWLRLAAAPPGAAMAKLLTHHDPYHIHAVFGLLALCNYLWRIGRWHVTGVAFPGEPGELLCVLIHVHCNSK